MDAGNDLVRRTAHQVTRDLQRLGRFRGDRLCGGKNVALEIVLVDDIVDQARRLGAVRRKALAEAEQGKGLLTADDPGDQQARSRLRHQPESTKGVRNTVRRVAKVRSQWRLSVVPMPTAMPSTPDTTGFSHLGERQQEIDHLVASSPPTA